MEEKIIERFNKWLEQNTWFSFLVSLMLAFLVSSSMTYNLGGQGGQTPCSGGGGGGVYGDYVGGGGGGAGGKFTGHFDIEPGAKYFFYIGEGGKEGQDGDVASFNIVHPDGSTSTFAAEGGKAAKGGQGGAGGDCINYGYVDARGEIWKYGVGKSIKPKPY